MCNNSNFFLCFQTSSCCSVDSTEAHHVTIPGYPIMASIGSSNVFYKPHKIKKNSYYRLCNFFSNGLVVKDLSNAPTSQVQVSGGFGNLDNNSENILNLFFFFHCYYDESISYLIYLLWMYFVLFCCFFFPFNL